MLRHAGAPGPQEARPPLNGAAQTAFEASRAAWRRLSAWTDMQAGPRKIVCLRVEEWNVAVRYFATISLFCGIRVRQTPSMFGMRQGDAFETEGETHD